MKTAEMVEMYKKALSQYHDQWTGAYASPDHAEPRFRGQVSREIEASKKAPDLVLAEIEAEGGPAARQRVLIATWLPYVVANAAQEAALTATRKVLKQYGVERSGNVDVTVGQITRQAVEKALEEWLFSPVLFQPDRSRLNVDEL